ncbi:unnamed protein product, partial [Effrenium voratum]
MMRSATTPRMTWIQSRSPQKGRRSTAGTESPARARASRRSMKPEVQEVAQEDGSDEESGSSDSKLELQSQRVGSPSREERPLRARGLEGSDSGILGYARQVAEEVGPSDGVSVSDILMFAKKVAANPSESGVVTESSGVGDFSEDGLLRFARKALKHDLASQGGTSMAESDVLAFARQVAENAGSAAGTDTGTDIFAFARKAAQNVSASGVSAPNSVLAFARQAAGEVSRSGVSQGSVADVLAFARQAAQQISRSGVGSESDGVSLAQAEISQSGVSESNILAFARKVAHAHDPEDRSKASDGGTDILDYARQAAEDVSRSGVATSQASVPPSQLFAARGVQSDNSSLPSDFVNYAQAVARDVSQGGFSRATE